MATYSFRIKLCSCGALLCFNVAATLFTEASKSADGGYPYNSFTIPCTVEAMKLCVSIFLLTLSLLRRENVVMSFSVTKFLPYSLPALCYFISNNCMFYIIRELGPTTFQITNNLKVLATGVLMRLIFGKRLTWLQWKALVLLVIGSAVTQLQSPNDSDGLGRNTGYIFVIINSIAAGAGGVASEKLLKGGGDDTLDNIHWQNIQLYLFGFAFGLASSVSSAPSALENGLFFGFNVWACATVSALTVAGLLVSFILKYLDNFAKCFVAALSIVFVAILHSLMQGAGTGLHLIIGIVLTCMALEQYNLPQ